MELEPAQAPRAWWKKALPTAEVDGVLLSWGLALLDSHGRVRSLPIQPACPQDPLCRAWDPTGSQCIDFFSPGMPDWDGRYTCYADARTVFFGKEQALLELSVPQDVVAARLTFYFRDDEFRRKTWPARGLPGEAAVALSLDEEPGFDLASRLRLDSGPDGRPVDLVIASCRASGGDPLKVAEQIRSSGFRYCRIVEADETSAPRTVVSP